MTSSIDTLITILSRLPSLGPRSARRMALHLIRKREKVLLPLLAALKEVAETIVTCEVCGNLDSSNPCYVCGDERRDRSVICVVEDVADLWAMERAKQYRGQYHVLGGVLSAIDGVGPDKLHLSTLVARASSDEVREVILATNATVDGQTTAHYITEMLSRSNVSITRLAQGIPMGGELDYLDDGTLGAALKARLPF
jgi:recombination protein RecR